MRFPEFSDEWQKTTLGEVAEIKKGSGISKNQLSLQGHPCILYGELYTTYSSEVIRKIRSHTEINLSTLILSQAGDVIIPSSGETAIDIAVARCVPVNNVALGGDLNIIRSSTTDGRFLAYQLNGSKKKEIAEFAQGIAVVHLYGRDLSKLNLSLPSFDEQKKIASFLSLIDERIETQRQTIEERKKQKKALICNIFKEIDFSMCPISDLGEMKNGYAFRSDTYDCNGSHRIITISNVTGKRYTNMSNHNSIRTLPQDIKPYQILQHNDILISLTGNVGRVSLCSFDGDLLNQRVGVLKVFESYYKEYVYHLLSSRHFEQSMIDRGQGAAQLNISKTDVENYNIPIPHDKSIIPILSNILNCFDERIEVEEELLQKYEEQKQYLLKKMFV